MHALNTLTVGRTVLTISHRLSTLGNVDEILVMRHGQIVEQGTFKQLKRKQGFFASLLEEQNRYNLDRGEEEAEVAMVRSISSATTLHLPALASATEPLIPVTTGDTTIRMPVVRRSKPEAPEVPEIAARMLKDKTLETLSVKLSTLKVKALNSQSKQRKDYIVTKGRILVQMNGKTLGEYQLSKPLYTIGRFPASDIQIPSQRVSRLHALIRWKNEAWVIEDAESLNGLTCRGHRIDQLALVDGDRISIDPTIVLQYYEGSGQ